MKLDRFSFLILVTLACAFNSSVSLHAQTVTYLANFNHSAGHNPEGSLIQATDGNFYGYAGSVFRMTPAGELSIVYDACPPNAITCPFAVSGPVLGSDGNLYGVMANGGVGKHWGTFYRLTLGGEYTTLWTFCAAVQCAPGPNGIMLASDGNFYGVSNNAIFRISSSGKFKMLYSFCSLPNCADGSYAITPPIQAIDGNFYGTTRDGGTFGGGVLYKLTLSGTYSVVYNFCDPYSGPCGQGTIPTSIVQDANGNLFGTTLAGGTNDWGTVFEITTEGQFLVLHNFSYNEANQPGNLILANDGNLYGTAEATLFESSLAGAGTLLHTFLCCDEGYGPNGPVFQGTDGSLYGTTEYGPFATGRGTVFKFSNGFSPLVETVPLGGKVGQSVMILGNGLTGSTSVTFNGVAAEFTVESDTYIKATVPEGATTGIVSVISPSATLNSNPQFVITQ